MNIATVLRLIVALAKALKVSAARLAREYGDEDGCQAYLNQVVRIHKTDGLRQN